MERNLVISQRVRCCGTAPARSRQVRRRRSWRGGSSHRDGRIAPANPIQLARYL